jgi:3-deoxy-D-manno-octulosonic-acid transferase
MLEFFTHLFLQNEDSAANLRSLLDPNSISVAGDTRFDRVLEIAQSFTPIPEIEAWLENAEKIMVAGSTWPEDEKMIASLKNRLNNLTLIIAPHHVDEASLQKTDLIFPGSIRMSRLLKNEPQPKSQIMIADTIGHLSKLYHYATLSYVGGGFSSTGIHNILEPAVYSKPVIFGPKFQKYAEAAALIQAGGGFSVKTADEFEIQVKILLKAEDLYHKTALEAGRFIFDHAGATRTVTEYIYINRLLTK